MSPDEIRGLLDRLSWLMEGAEIGYMPNIREARELVERWRRRLSVGD